MFLKWLYVLLLLQDGFACDTTWKKAVIHKDRITEDNHGSNAIIETTQLPQGQNGQVS